MGQHGQTMITLDAVSKTFGQTVVVQGVSGHVEKGQVIALLGPSGSGKSTLLRCLNLLEKPTSGRILIGDQDITHPACPIDRVRRKVAMVFQHFNLFPHMRVCDNIGYAPRRVLKEDAAHVDAKIDRLLKQVGLHHKKNAYPGELSGGQKQRIAIVRALAMEPDVILFDEPTSALDPEMVKEVLDVIDILKKKRHMTMVIVTHEMAFAKKIADRIWFLDHGVLLEDTPPHVFFTKPQTARARQFLAQVMPD